MTQTAPREIESDLAQAERDGLIVSLIGRSIVLAVVGTWLAYGAIAYHASTVIGLALVLLCLAASLALIRYFRRGGRIWVAFVTPSASASRRARWRPAASAAAPGAPTASTAIP